MDPDKKEEQFGYLFGLSFRAELKSDATTLKGVAIPKGDISFDINMKVKDYDAEGGPLDVT